MKKIINNILFLLPANCGILNQEEFDILQYFLNAILISTPIIVLILIAVDITKAAVMSKEDEMKKAQQNAIKRIVIGIIIEFLPIIVNIILSISGLSGSCKIW